MYIGINTRRVRRDEMDVSLSRPVAIRSWRRRPATLQGWNDQRGSELCKDNVPDTFIIPNRAGKKTSQSASPEGPGAHDIICDPGKIRVRS